MLDWRLHPVPQPVLDSHRKYDKITIPVFHECGWYDGAGWSQFENFVNLQSEAGPDIARDGQYMVCGPWPHGMIFQNTVGQLNFGFAADNASSGLNQHQIAFFDKYLRGKDIALPKVRYFVMGKNEWRTSETYPLRDTQWTRFYLHSNGNANTANGDGFLSTDKPVQEPVDRYLYDPHNPVPTTGGPLIGALAGGDIIAGPIEQYHVEKRHDVVCYTTAPMEEELEITGPLQLYLFASSSACDTDFCAKLVHVYPDGRAYNLAEGIIRASGRNFGNEREPIEPDKIYEFVITLGHTGQHFPKGHQIRVDITSSNYPLFDRNMNTGNFIGEDEQGIVAMQSIYHDAEHASYIDLPIIPIQGN
jgi:putative CocE/NonD family hydrolase